MTERVPAWVGGRLQPVEKLAVHRLGLRHHAVSVFVRDAAGRVLLQRRAAGKYHSAGLWANSCCTHPHWGEAPDDCARRRLAEELGLTGLSLASRGTIEYRAPVGGGLVEHEVVALFLADAPSSVSPSPDPAEVAALRWVRPEALAAEIAAAPERFTVWLRLYMRDHAGRILGGEAAIA